MALRTFRQWARDLSPTTLRGTWGELLTQTFGFIFDAIADATYEGGGAAMLDSPTFPADALGHVGNERLMERYTAETDEQYKERVRGAWVAWPQAGTIGAMIGQLTAAGFTVEIKEMTDWDWDGDAANWSRFWVVITDHGWSPTHWGDGRLWGEGVWGCDATVAESETLIRIVSKWKPGHVVAIIVIVMDDVAWAAGQPDGTWGDPANRNPAALYHYYR